MRQGPRGRVVAALGARDTQVLWVLQALGAPCSGPVWLALRRPWLQNPDPGYFRVNYMVSSYGAGVEK